MKNTGCTELGKRQVEDREEYRIYLGLQLDGVEEYKDLIYSDLSQYSQITVQHNPTVESFPDSPILVKTWWPHSVNSLTIKGADLHTGDLVSQYDIRVDNTSCDMSSATVLDNSIVFLPPVDKPDVDGGGDEMDVKLHLGTNMALSPGRVRYQTSILGCMPCSAALFASVALVCIVALVVCCVACRKNHKRKEDAGTKASSTPFAVRAEKDTEQGQQQLKNSSIRGYLNKSHFTQNASSYITKPVSMETSVDVQPSGSMQTRKSYADRLQTANGYPQTNVHCSSSKYNDLNREKNRLTQDGSHVTTNDSYLTPYSDTADGYIIPDDDQPGSRDDPLNHSSDYLEPRDMSPHNHCSPEDDNLDLHDHYLTPRGDYLTPSDDLVTSTNDEFNQRDDCLIYLTPEESTLANSDNDNYLTPQYGNVVAMGGLPNRPDDYLIPQDDDMTTHNEHFLNSQDECTRL